MAFLHFPKCLFVAVAGKYCQPQAQKKDAEGVEAWHFGQQRHLEWVGRSSANPEKEEDDDAKGNSPKDL